MAGTLGGGRIKRIKIQNFMTYDNVELYPKKGLNLIVGLNGTGKSSIMCAICLGLAGKPHFTGRATQLSDFIKHGCQEAEIEIELESGDYNVVINRKIKGEKCEWHINKNPASLNEVTSTVRQFNIDTSNLCQFLPQEKVAEFSKMDKKQRLENMLQAIGEPHLFALFDKLKDLHTKICDLEQNIKKFQMNKNTAEEENDRISDEVVKQEERNRLKNDLKELHKKKTVAIYQQVYDEFHVLKEKEKEQSEKVKALKKERDEAVSKEDSIHSLHQKSSKKLSDLNSLKKTLISKITNNSDILTNLNGQVENEKIEYRNKLAEKEDQKKRLHDVNMLIEGLERQLTDELNKFPNYNEQEVLNTKALAELQSEISEWHQKIERAAAEKNQVDYAVMQLKSQLASLQDEQNKKMENLKRRDRDTYEAAQWLLENRQRFKSNVYLPIMLEVKINSPEYTEYVENVIPFRDMIAFVCEDEKDCEYLTDILKNQKRLRVNIVMAPNVPMSNFELPPIPQEYRLCGLECVIKDLFTAPEPIMRYLCACCNIHRIAVTKSAVNSENIEFILQKYPFFFSENTRISGKRSRYGQKNLSVKKDFIMAQNLLIHHNEEMQQEVLEKLKQMEERVDMKTKNLDEYKAILADKEKLQEKLRQERKSLHDHKRTIEKLKFDNIQKRKIRAQFSISINEEEEKIKITKKIQSINENREIVLTEINALFQEVIEVEKEIVKTILNMNSYTKKLKLHRAGNEEIHEKVKAAEKEFEEISKIHHEKRRYGKRLLKEIVAFGADYVKYIEDPRPDHMENISLEEIEQRISHVQAELNLNEDNQPLVEEYYARKRKIESIQEKIDNIEDNVEEIKQNIQKKKTEWLEPLEYHIGNINKKFSRYFKQLSCAGEISLDIPDNSDDFTKYGLQIKLKFHDDVPFTELSQTHHSGGECSVAAIVFILSLQELTEVPFRCIDEINQGMDSINERKIYQLIADSVGQDRCSQYFLLTPKLLDGLEYPDDVAVHIIFNSCFLNSKLDVKKHLEIARSA